MRKNGGIIMYIYLFVCSMLVPLCMIVLGFRYKKEPPKDRDGWSGYRTTMSRLNQDTWKFAHEYYGTLLLVSGIPLAIISAIVMFVIKGRSDFEMIVVYLVFIQIGIMTLMMIPTELKLNKVFDKRGKRRLY